MTDRLFEAQESMIDKVAIAFLRPIGLYGGRKFSKPIIRQSKAKPKQLGNTLHIIENCSCISSLDKRCIVCFPREQITHWLALPPK